MKKFIVSFFTYCMYIVSLSTMVLGIATFALPIIDGVYNAMFLWVMLFCLGLQTFVVSRKLLDI